MAGGRGAPVQNGQPRRGGAANRGGVPRGGPARLGVMHGAGRYVWHARSPCPALPCPVLPGLTLDI
jgi:hypothetical protein